MNMNGMQICVCIYCGFMNIQCMHVFMVPMHAWMHICFMCMLHMFCMCACVVDIGIVGWGVTIRVHVSFSD